MNLYPYQEEGVNYILVHQGTLLSDEMGLGKTVQTIGVINALPHLRNI
jgi:SNF2 family DNA or RNA helicase